MIPDFQTLMLPVLRVCADGIVHNKAAIKQLADQFDLTEEERHHMLPSGKQTTFVNRCMWAKTFLKQAGLVDYPARSQFVITDTGRDVLAQSPDRIDMKYLEQFDSYIAFRNRRGTAYGTRPHAEEITPNAAPEMDETAAGTPDDRLAEAYTELHDTLAADLLDRVRTADPDFFEQVIVDLLLAMGYGGTHTKAGRAIGRTGDDGVDGVIDQDPLGVDQIYIQAKRYKDGNNVGAGAIRDFFGALNLKKASKGILVTTSNFTSDAERTARELGMRIVLINGPRLARLMVQYNIGCRIKETLHLKDIDEEFFEG